MNRFLHILPLAFAVLSASVVLSCSDPFDNMPHVQNGYPVNLSAGVGDMTKISLEGLSMTWEEDDALAMFADTDDAPVLLKVYDVDAGLSEAQFKGSVDVSEQPSVCYFAYPSDVDHFTSDGTVVFDYSSQDGSHKPFLCGYSAYDPDEMNVGLVHVGSVLRISNNMTGLTSITVRGNSSECFSRIICDASSGETSVADDASEEIVLNSSTGFGREVFIMMPPVAFAKGFTLICETSEGVRTYKSYSSDGLSSSGYDFSSHRGYIYDMTLDESPVVLDISCVPNHTFNADGYLTGTEVFLTLGRSGVSDKIATWSAALTDAEGHIVRSYDSSERPYNAVMTDSNDWPYLSPGNYALTVNCSVHGDVYIGTRTVTVAEPDVIDVHALTTYSVFKNSGAEAANNTGHSSDAVYDIRSEIKIAPALFSHPKYSSTSPVVNYSTTGISSGEKTLSLSGIHNPSLGDIILPRAEHTVNAALTFAGYTYADAINVHVTGLPYSYDFYDKSVSVLEGAGWTCRNVTYNNTFSKCAIQFDGSNGYLISPFYHFPEQLSVAYSVQAQYYRAWGINVSSRKINLYIGATSSESSTASTYASHECAGNNNTGKSFGTYPGVVQMSSSYPYLSIYHNNANVGAQIDYLCIYVLTLGYSD